MSKKRSLDSTLSSNLEGHASRPKDKDRCHCFLVRKRRYCNQKRSLPSLFCGNHAELELSVTPLVEEATLNNDGNITKTASKRRRKSSDKRIPCPLDPSHTVWNFNLKQHLKICPKAKEMKNMEQLPYYRKDVNLGPVNDSLLSKNSEEQSKDSVTGRTVVNEAQKLAKAILCVHMKLFHGISEAFHEQHVERLTYEDIYSVIQQNDESTSENIPRLMLDLEKIKVKSGGIRHVQQQASIVGHLRNIGVLRKLNDKHSPLISKNEEIRDFVEMGAGRAVLGLVVAGISNANLDKVTEHEKVSLYMVERSGSRSKADSSIRTINKKSEGTITSQKIEYFDIRGINIQRLKCDLKDIHLPIALPKRPFYSIGKHVCGVATDLALRSLEPMKGVCQGCTIATCCHGICNWRDYVGQKYLVAAFSEFNIDFQKAHFDLLVKWTGGATLNHVSVEVKHDLQTLNEDHIDNRKILDDSSCTGIKQIVASLNLKCGVRGLGRACQRIIDFGRMEYMREVLGFHSMCDIQHYVDETVTPQNALLIGRR